METLVPLGKKPVLVAVRGANIIFVVAGTIHLYVDTHPGTCVEKIHGNVYICTYVYTHI